ncbi:right-handed parallel beta-helix repeat-containing protein [Salinigranum sp. GCM10025319]|uniref:right-handed parallel beta-helix repeat-containing protein n=1 Tax=Salinigranum sp. GCM10025319 TaxID=3252687 RepID=UPI00361990AA
MKTDVLHDGSDPTFRVWGDGSDYVASDGEGEVARDADARVVIEACDEPGAAIRLAPQTIFEYEDPPLSLTSDEIGVYGSTSSVVKLADGQIESNAGDTPEIQVDGEHVTFSGWTFDGNEPGQGATDTFGIYFTSGAKFFHAEGMKVLRAVGDGFGEIKGGTTIRSCFIDECTQDGIDLVNTTDELVVIEDCFIRGYNPVHAWTPDGSIGRVHVRDCHLIGDGTPALRYGDDGSDNIRDIKITGCRLEKVDNSNDSKAALKLGYFDDVSFKDVRIEHNVIFGRGIDVDENGYVDPLTVNNNQFRADGSTDHAINVGAGGSYSFRRNSFEGYTDEINIKPGTTASIAIEHDDADPISVSNVSNLSDVAKYNGVWGAGPLGGADAPPANAVMGDLAVATSTWDPNSDASGEMVVYDGSGWNGVGTMPNL